MQDNSISKNEKELQFARGPVFILASDLSPKQIFNIIAVAAYLFA
jgi:hypothetical protein